MPSNHANWYRYLPVIILPRCLHVVGGFFFLKLNTSICVPPKKQQQKPAVHHVECSKIQGFCSTRTNTEILHVPSPVAGHTKYSTRKSHGKSALRGAKARPDFILLNSL